MIRLLGGTLLNTPTVRLEGRQITLRPPTLRDWVEWAELRAESRDFLTPWEPAWPSDALTRTAFTRRIRRQTAEWRDDIAYSFLTVGRNSGTLVGGLGLGNVRRGVAQTATLGYWVGQPYARRGYTSEAVRLVLSFAFGQLNLHRIEASCLQTNEASRNLLLKLGFASEGVARGYLRIAGAWRDHQMFALLREDLGGAVSGSPRSS